jgi:hypothetical protein
MNSCHTVQRDLSLFADGELDAAARAEISTHLDTCAACRGVLADLERVVVTARSLGPMAPPEHLWLEVAGQMRLPSRETPVPLTRPRPPRAAWQWAGLSAALLAVTTAVYLFSRPDGSPTSATVPAEVTSEASAGTVEAVNAELNLALQHYERAIAELERVTGPGSGSIEASVAATLQRDRAAIDKAIAESRAAVTEAPDNEPARLSLFDALRRKISVLQATVALISEMNQGDPAGAARAVEGLGRES